MNRRFMSIVALLTVSIPVQAFNVSERQTKGTAGQPGEWLTSFSAGAREAGLGNAGAALMGSAAFYANPAGIVNRQSGEVSLLVAPLFASTHYQALSASYPAGEDQSVGAGLVYMGSGEAEQTNALGESIGSFEEKNMAIFLSFAKSLFGNKLDAGINAKAVRQSLSDYSATGYGADIGLQAPLFSDRLRVGAAIQNIVAPQLQLKDEKDKFPTIIKTGLAMKWEPFNRPLLITTDFFLNPSRWNAGIEFSPANISRTPLFIRLGVNQREYTMGLGIGSHPVSLDYALALHELEVLHRIGLTFRFSMERRMDAEWERLRRKESELDEKEHALRRERRGGTATGRSAAPPPGNGKQNGPPQPVETTGDLMSRAYDAIDAEKYEQARQLIMRAVELDPLNDAAINLYEKIKDIVEIDGKR